MTQQPSNSPILGHLVAALDVGVAKRLLSNFKLHWPCVFCRMTVARLATCSP